MLILNWYWYWLKFKDEILVTYQKWKHSTRQPNYKILVLLLPPTSASLKCPYGATCTKETYERFRDPSRASAYLVLVLSPASWSGSESPCRQSSLSWLATLALAACGWRQTLPGGKQPFSCDWPSHNASLLEVIQWKNEQYANAAPWHWPHAFFLTFFFSNKI